MSIHPVSSVTETTVYPPEPAIPAEEAPTNTISMTIPVVLILITIIVAAFLPADLFGQRTMKIYTGNEPALPFNTDEHRAVEPHAILQFFGARCAAVTPLTATRGLFRYKDAHQYYPEYKRLPFDVYFRPFNGDIYYLSSGSAMFHITLPMRYEGTYYVVIRDQTKPAILTVNSKTLIAEFRLCCALSESIIPAYLNR